MNKYQVKTIVALLLAVSVFLGTIANAGVPSLIQYQGRLTDSSGQPVPNGNYLIQFRIYDANTGGSVLWDNNYRTVTVQNGLFNYLLGDSTHIPSSLFLADTIRYLGIKVGADAELSPRVRLVSNAYSFRSEFADSSRASRYSDSSLHSKHADTAHFSFTSDTALMAQSTLPSTVDSVTIMIGGVSLTNISQSGAIVGQTIIWNGSAWVADSLHEVDPKVSTNSVGAIPKWNGSSLTNSNIIDNGNVGIGTATPSSALEVAGTVHSSVGGFKFPDGTTQTTAATVPGAILSGIATVPTGSDSVRITNQLVTVNSVVCITLRQNDPTATTLNHSHTISVGPGIGGTAVCYSGGAFTRCGPTDPTSSATTNSASSTLQRYWVVPGAGFFTIHTGIAVSSSVGMSYICIVQ